MALKIFQPEYPEQKQIKEKTRAVPELALRNRIREEAATAHIELNETLLTEEEMLCYDAIADNALTPDRLIVFGNRLKKSAKEHEKNPLYIKTLENRKRFFPFIMKK